jgi:hypothetical protein
MTKDRDPDPITHDPVTLRALADEADGHRHLTAFACLSDATLIRAMAAALRAYAHAQEGREAAAVASDSRHEAVTAA